MRHDEDPMEGAMEWLLIGVCVACGGIVLAALVCITLRAMFG